MTPIEGGDYLRKDVPDIIFRGILLLCLQFLDCVAKITAAAVLHVQMEVFTVLDVVSMVVADNIRMIERMENGEFGMQLVSLFLLHAVVIDFFSAQDLVPALVDIGTWDFWLNCSQLHLIFFLLSE